MNVLIATCLAASCLCSANRVIAADTPIAPARDYHLYPMLLPLRRNQSDEA